MSLQLLRFLFTGLILIWIIFSAYSMVISQNLPFEYPGNHKHLTRTARTIISVFISLFPLFVLMLTLSI